MRLTLEPTEHFFFAGDVMVRMWTGKDEQDRGVIAFVSAVAFQGDNPEAVAEGLVSIPPPDAATAKRWAAEVLSRTEDTEPEQP